MSIIEKVNSSADVKKLTPEELIELCAELRKFEIESVAKTGGHLASNLGTVELTLAIHRLYDTSRDRLIFDVGHQSYTHKIITGRRERFDTLRQHGGLSGFPKPREAVDDAFIAGHASNSVSVALGMARARSLLHEDYNVIAIIGDGALTGGLAHEGLADAAESNEPMVIILNDNQMSINPNVGGTTRMLQNMRVKPGYISFKRVYRKYMLRIPAVYNAIHRVKERLKKWLIPSNSFMELGLDYIGPVDGHNIDKLCQALSLAKDTSVSMKRPVVVHVLTTKGMGCSYAMAHPDKYHGVGKFDPVTGEIEPSGISFSDKFGEYLCNFAELDAHITAITAAMAGGTGLECFADRFPDRFFDVGIAEGHGTALAAGMAKQGLTPVFAVYSSFLQRGFDMLIHDVSLLKLHAVFCIDRAGLVGSDGETHHGVFDVAYLSLVPGMNILCPASFQELHDMFDYALHGLDCPVALRYPRGGEGRYTESNLSAEVRLCKGADITIVCYGTMVNEVLDAADILRSIGIEADIIKLGCIAPNDYSLCLDSLSKTGKIIVAEEVCAQGCVGSAIISAAASRGIAMKAVRLMNLGDGIIAQGTIKELRHDYKIDAEAIAAEAAALCGRAEKL